MANDDAADSISWPDSMADLGVLENLLKCGICYEFMNTALVTPCSHNFCSVCIRKFMQYRTSCPQCLSMVNEIELKNNRTLDEIIVVMRRLRGPLSQTLQGVKIAVKRDSPTPKKAASPPKSISKKSASIQQFNDAPVLAECEVLQSPQRLLNNSSFEASPLKTPHNSSDLLRSPSGSPSQSQSRPEKIKVRSLFNMMRSPVTLTPSKSSISNGVARKVVMVNCPICQVEIPEANINIHIDKCLERSNKEVVAAIKPPEKKPESRRRLPKLVYELMKESDLRKKCAETKLSTQGDKKTLVKRHKRYTLLYNSECDSINPRPMTETIKQVEREEREEAKANSKVFKALQVDRKAQPEVISSAQTKYKSEHKSHFEKLQAELRLRQKSREAPSASTSSSNATSTVLDPSTSANSAISAVKIPENLLEPEVDDADSLDSPGTPNSEMDLILTQQSPVIRKMTKSLAPIVLSDDDADEDSLESMFSQPIPSSSSSKKRNKRRVEQKTESDDDMWSSDLIREKPKQKNSQTESLPLRRSSRKRSKNGSDNN